MEQYQVDNIPTELINENQWVYWSWEQRPGNGKPTKPPKNPHTGGYASTALPNTWGSLQEALRACQDDNGAGIGIVLTDDDGLAGIDLDHCRNIQTGQLSVEAMEILDALDAYAEISPSGTGIRLLFQDPGPVFRSTTNGTFEYYRSGRYLTVTGEVLPGRPSSLLPVTDVFPAIYARYFKGMSGATGTIPDADPYDPPLITEEVVKAMRWIPADDYNIWLKIGMAIHFAAPNEEGLKLWDDWSKRCPEKYDPSACGTKWGTFHRERPDGVKIGSIIQLAKEFGYVPPALPWQSLLDKPRKLIQVEQVSQEDIRTEVAEKKKAQNYPDLICPDTLWIGAFAEIADIMQSRTWETWLGALVAVGAYANRQLYCSFRRKPVYGMVWGLLINYSATGKTQCTNVCRSLLPTAYRVREGVQSGPALANTLASIARNRDGSINTITPIPAALVLEEWTRLVKNMKITNSTLQDDLNTLFHRQHPWSLTRADYRGHAGDVVIPTPALSILGTSTPDMFQKDVTREMVFSGGINRHLILPGSHRRNSDDYGSREGQVDHSRRLALWATEHLPERTVEEQYSWGIGEPIWDRYTPEAYEKQTSWWGTFDPTLKTDTSEDEVDLLRRLDIYSVLIPALYAYLDKSPVVTVQYVDAMIAAVETAATFTRWLFASQEGEMPPQQKFRSDLDEKIEKYISQHPGCARREVGRSLRKNGGYKSVLIALEELLDLNFIAERDKCLFPLGG